MYNKQTTDNRLVVYLLTSLFTKYLTKMKKSTNTPGSYRGKSAS